MSNNDYILRSDALKAILGVSIYDTIEELEGARTIAENTWADGLYDAYKIIEEEVDAADLYPVRHGRWIPHPGHHDFDLCSVCGTGTRRRIYEDGGEIEYNYKICPWCGAQMLSEPPGEVDDGADMAL